MRLLPVLLVLSLSACGEPDARSPVEQGTELVEALHRVDAYAQYKDGNFAAFTATLEAITATNPRPKDVYNLACGYALTDRPDEAVERLTWLVDRGTPYLMLEDPDLDSLRGRSDFQVLAERLKTYSRAAEYLAPARKIAIQRYREGDHASFIVIMEKVAPLSDAHIDTYNLACAYALSGRHEEAIATLELLADVGEHFGAAEDPDFDDLRGDPAFEAVVARLERAG